MLDSVIVDIAPNVLLGGSSCSNDFIDCADIFAVDILIFISVAENHQVGVSLLERRTALVVIITDHRVCSDCNDFVFEI